MSTDAEVSVGTAFANCAISANETTPPVSRRIASRVQTWRVDNDEYYRERKREYQQTDSYKRSFRRSHLKAKYGLTLEQYDDMLDRQGGGCAICDEPPGDTALHVDHCHDTGRIRGLLCFRCNSALGNLRHDPEVIGRALEYVAVHWRVERLKGEPGLTR